MGESPKFKVGDRVIYNGTWEYGPKHGWHKGDECTVIATRVGQNYKVERMQDSLQRVFWDKYLDPVKRVDPLVLKPKRKMAL